MGTLIPFIPPGLSMRAVTEEPHFGQNFGFLDQSYIWVEVELVFGFEKLTRCVRFLFENWYSVKEPLP